MCEQIWASSPPFPNLFPFSLLFFVVFCCWASPERRYCGSKRLQQISQQIFRAGEDLGSVGRFWIGSGRSETAPTTSRKLYVNFTRQVLLYGSGFVVGLQSGDNFTLKFQTLRKRDKTTLLKLYAHVFQFFCGLGRVGVGWGWVSGGMSTIIQHVSRPEWTEGRAGPHPLPQM